MKKKILWTLGVILSPVLLFILLVILLYIPPVQRWAVRCATEYASEATGMNVSLQRVRLSFPLDIDLQELSVTNPTDTLLAVDHVVVDLNFSRILKGSIGVDAIDIVDGTVDTQDMIAEMRLAGWLGKFHLNADDVSLTKQSVNLSAASLQGCDLDIQMQDTTVVDTTESEPVMWRIALGDIDITDTRIAFHMPGDSMAVRAGVRHLALSDGDIDLGAGIYSVGMVSVDADSVCYDLPYEAAMSRGFDYNHIRLHDLLLDADGIRYALESGDLSVNIARCEAKEKSGFTISSLTGRILMDSTSIHLPDFQLATPHSTAQAKVDMEWSALSQHQRGHLSAMADAQFGREDIITLSGDALPLDMVGMIPHDPVSLKLEAVGNVDTMDVRQLRVMVAPMMDIQADGRITDPLAQDSLGAVLNWDIKTYDMSLVNRVAGLGNSVRIPQMHLTGETRIQGPQYIADLLLRQAKGVMTLRANYNDASQAYGADLKIRNLQLHNFLPQDSIYEMSLSANANGVGTNLLSPRARLKAKLDIEHLRYGNANVDSTILLAKLANGQGRIDINSDNNVLRMDACAETVIRHDSIESANFSLDLTHADLQALRITKKPLVASMLLHFDGSSNLTDTHKLDGSIEAVELVTPDTVFHPLDLRVSLLMSPDTIHAAAYDGDLELSLASADGLDRVMSLTDKFSEELQRQMKERYVDQNILRTFLPRLQMHIKSGRRNPLGNILASMGYSYQTLHFDLVSNPEEGLNGGGRVGTLNTGAIVIDSITWNIYQDTTGVKMNAMVKNGPKNRQAVFQANTNVEVTHNGVSAALRFVDGSGKKGIDLGAHLEVEEEGLRLHFEPLSPIIAYRGFTINPDNFIYLRNEDQHLDANVDLLADDGTGIKIYSTPNEEAQQDLTVSIHNFNLGELSSVMPFMPVVTGMLAGDFHLVQQDSVMTVMVDAGVRRMTYEGAKMGDIGLNAVYLPNTDGTHFIDGIVSHNGNEVLMLSGTYSPDEVTGGSIDAQASLQRLPLALANGFIPDNMIELEGYALGDLSVSGPVSHPEINGQFATDSMYVKSVMYSLNLRFPNDVIYIKDNVLDFDKIEAYSTGRNPVTLDGTVDMRNLEEIGLNISLRARNFELINAPKRPRAVAYGKVFVNVGTTLTGTLDNMVMRGGLDILGNTDVTYVLTDSPLTVEDQLAELVEFVDFSDTIQVDEEVVKAQHIDMQLKIGIDQGTTVHALLSEDGTNYIDLVGGGDLNMTYSTENDMRLFGRYTIVEGLMNYSLMVMALKNFRIQQGSYVEFMGEMLNPRLSIQATERVKASVYENEVPRSVAFDVGLSVSQTLDNMGLEFTLDAPDDLTVSNQLASMGADARGKAAVTLLATGMYIGEGSQGFNTTNALNSFLQGQINNIAGKALNTIDLNFGMENSNSATGAQQTDYNFSFAKRFWGNRISVIIGGKVSSGSEAQNSAQSIIDNVSLEYRLDKSATRYVRIYYDRSTESLLEGQIVEMGAGVVFRRKSTRLGELFIFRKKE